MPPHWLNISTKHTVQAKSSLPKTRSAHASARSSSTALPADIRFSAKPINMTASDSPHFRDAAAMKLNATSNRGSKKDFWDVHCLLDHFYSPKCWTASYENTPPPADGTSKNPCFISTTPSPSPTPWILWDALGQRSKAESADNCSPEPPDPTSRARACCRRHLREGGRALSSAFGWSEIPVGVLPSGSFWHSVGRHKCRTPTKTAR